MSVGNLQRNAQTFQAVGANQIASASIAVGKTLDNLQLVLGGTTFTKAHISNIKLRANAKPIIDASANQIEKINAFRGDAGDATHLEIQFFDKRGFRVSDRVAGCLDTSLLSTLSAEVSIGAATAPTLRGVLHEAPRQAAAGAAAAPVAGLIAKTLAYPYQVATGGKVSISLPFGAVRGTRIKRLHIDSAGGLVTALELKQDQIQIHESLAADNNFDLAQWGLVPQTNWYSVDFFREGLVEKVWDTRDAESVELLPTFSGADSGYILLEVLDPLPNL